MYSVSEFQMEMAAGKARLLTVESLPTLESMKDWILELQRPEGNVTQARMETGQCGLRL